MEEIQTIKITREEMERLSEDFLLRMLRSLAIRADWRRVAACAIFLPSPLRERVTDLVLAGEDGLEEIRSQATEGRDIFKNVGLTDEEQEKEEEFAEIIEAQIKSQGSFQNNIVYEISSIEGKELSVAEILSLILVCVNKGYYDFAREAAISLLSVKRVQVLAILS